MSQSFFHGQGRGRSSLLKSRLPNIQMVGKYTTVDEDEPPDVPLQAFGYDADGDQSISSGFETTFDSADAEDATKFLRKTFHILEPQGHAYKRMPDTSRGYFFHCPRGVPIAQEYSRINRLMRERAQLELLRDCLFRVRSAQMFAEELEGLVHMECRTVYAIRHGCVAETPVTKLYCLNALCEDLRLHVSHWNSIKQRLNTNRWLQPQLGQLCIDFQQVMHVLTSVIREAVWNLDQLIHIGFEVFAHCNMESLTPEIMWNITRGLEDFNNIINGLKLNTHCENTHLRHCFTIPNSSSSADVNGAVVNSPIKKPLRTIPFSKVLSILANERSRSAAKLTHQFFTKNEHFLRIVNAGNLPSFEWGDYVPHQKQPHSMIVRSETSDYFTQTGSNASLNATFLQVGSMRAPDLSNLVSPLIYFSQSEQEFAESFLLIVCNSTSLLRKNEPAKTHHRSRHGNKPTDLKTPMSPVVGRPPRVQFQGEKPVMTRSDSQRKTVSWGDNADNTIRSAVVAKYMDSLWLHLGRNLDLFLDEPAWQGRNCLLESEMGSVLLFNDTITTVLRNMIEHVCYKDMFPPTSVQPLLGVVFRLHALTAYGAWDAFISASLASETTDKCQPCLLSGDTYSTYTGKLLRDSFKPLMSILQDMSKSASSNSGAEDFMQHPEMDWSVFAGVAWRLLTTCKLSFSWCSTKVQQLMSSWSVNQFLLLTHTDLRLPTTQNIGAGNSRFKSHSSDETCTIHPEAKFENSSNYIICVQYVELLVDCTKNAAYLMQGLKLNEEGQSTTVINTLSICQTNMLHQQIGQVNCQIQSLSGSAMKCFLDKYNEMCASFLQENLLPARMWKRKIPADEQATPSQYAIDTVYSLLLPIVNGISNLSVTSQIGVISMVTVSLCNAWLALILKERIRFSLWGAVQLGVDFDYVHKELGKMVANDEVQQSITNLAIFQKMKGIIVLLKKQPSQKQTGKFRDCSMDNLLCDSASTVPSTEAVAMDMTSTSASVASGVGNGTHKLNMNVDTKRPLTSQEEEAVCAVPNIQEWLALRAVGGSKPWKFSGCFSRSSSGN